MRKLTGWQWSSAVLCAALGGMLAGCSSSPSSPAKTTTPTPATTSASAPASPSAPASSSGGSAAAQADIKADWEAFFSAKTPTSRRIQLLQNGQQFASVLKAQAQSPLAQSASAKVLKVTVTSSTQATVSYDVIAGGAVALKDQSGTAVLQGGTWKVGDSSFCGLLKLEGASGLPAACG